MGTTFAYLLCGSLVIYIAFMIRFILLSFKAHSNLVRFEYENIREQWEKDGEPDGMLFWRAPTRSKKFKNRLFLSNPGVTSLIWKFKTPKWVKDYPQTQKYLKSMRMNSLVWNIGILFLMALFFVMINMTQLQK